MRNWEQKQRNVAVFRGTMSMCEGDNFLRQAIEESNLRQRVYAEGADLNESPAGDDGKAAAGTVGPCRYDGECKVTVSRKRTLEAARAYSGKRVCVLNFASWSTAGGGVTTGSRAQEENLCRSTTLYKCLTDSEPQEYFYGAHGVAIETGQVPPMYNDDCIYTPGVCVFKQDDETHLPMDRESWYLVDVITCAAPNLRYSNPTEEELEAVHEKRANRILDIAAHHGAEVVILGAFGCGAFRNPPAPVARGMMKAVKRHLHDFETIEFAVYCPPDYPSTNYDVFDRIVNSETGISR